MTPAEIFDSSAQFMAMVIAGVTVSLVALVYVFYVVFSPED